MFNKEKSKVVSISILASIDEQIESKRGFFSKSQAYQILLKNALGNLGDSIIQNN